MPYSITTKHEDCDGFGVVKDDDNKLMGCHDSREKAEKQITALNIAESESGGYRQADPDNDIFETKEEAEKKAAEIGCVGSHTHEIDGVTYFMPCEKMSDYEDLTGMKHTSEDDYKLTERQESEPAPKEDQIQGSKKNKPGSASGKAGDIKFSEATEKSIKTIVDAHNESVKEKGMSTWRRLRMPTAKAVVRRGFGAYSVSHRPGVSRNAWGLARLKAFGYLLMNDKPKNPKYLGDNDLLPKQHPKYAPKEKKNKDFRHEISVPRFIRNNASRGLENLQFAGQGLTEKTKREARQMRDGVISHDKALRMQAWFKRHISDFEGDGAKEFLSGETDRMSPGLVAWLLWGGSLAAATRMDAMKWAERQVARHEDDRSKSRPQPSNQAVGIIKRMSENKETRFFELRAEADIDSDDLIFTGYASVFDSPYRVADSRGVYNEIVNPGAFSKTLDEQDDVKFLINHDGIPLARTKSKTLELREDEHGLFVKAKLDESNPKVAEIASALKRGDLSEMSFGFHAIKDEFSDSGETRTLKELRLLDVSVVTWPANPATLASIRGVDLGELQEVLAEVRSDQEPTEDQVAKITEVIGQLSELLPKAQVSKSNVRAAVRDLEIWDMQSRS